MFHEGVCEALDMAPLGLLGWVERPLVLPDMVCLRGGDVQRVPGACQAGLTVSMCAASLSSGSADRSGRPVERALAD